MKKMAANPHYNEEDNIMEDEEGHQQDSRRTAEVAYLVLDSNHLSPCSKVIPSSFLNLF